MDDQEWVERLTRPRMTLFERLGKMIELGGDHALHLVTRANKILNQAVDRVDRVSPDMISSPKRRPLGKLALLPDDATYPFKLDPERLIGTDNSIQFGNWLGRDA